ncbi:MAG: hypothetical protein AAF998_24585 [Bacteroidota bacterium]
MAVRPSRRGETAANEVAKAPNTTFLPLRSHCRARPVVLPGAARRAVESLESATSTYSPQVLAVQLKGPGVIGFGTDFRGSPFRIL